MNSYISSVSTRFDLPIDVFSPAVLRNEFRGPWRSPEDPPPNLSISESLGAPLWLDVSRN